VNDRPGPVPRRASIPYEPALDGIRALAVIAVVLYHAEVGWARGGWLGVDAFFVLSGFLITSLLLIEYKNRSGIGLGVFWSRRARRLLPALFLVIVAVIGYAAFIARPDELETIRRHGLASLFYVTNWQFIAEDNSYFALFRTESPFQHLWSLAIEEQWYLIWPPTLLLLLWWRRGSFRAVMWVCIGLGLASAAWMAYLYEPGSDPSRIYFGTDTRAQSLLVGSALAAALMSGVRVREFTARYVVPVIASVAGILLVWVWSTGSDDAGWYYRGGFLLLACGVALVILASVQPEGNIVRSTLSLPPLRWIGLISYGIYLWHWPIFVVLTRQRPFLRDLTYVQLTLVRLLATLAVATLSYYLVERPIRQGALSRRIKFSPVLLPLSAVLLVALILGTTRGATPSFDLPQAEALTTTNGEGGPPGPDALAEGLDTASRPRPTGSDDATRVLIVGDSVAYSMAGGFTPDIQRRDNLVVWNQTVLFCELAEGPRQENGEVVQRSTTCDDWADTWARDIEEFDPQVAVLQVGAWEIFNRRVDDTWLVFGTPEYDEYFLGVLEEAIESLGSNGATVVLLSTPDFDRLDTVSAREWTQNETWRTEHINGLFARAASASSESVVLDFGGWLCPDGCIADLANGVPVREDGVHFSDEGAEVAAQWLAPQLRAVGLTNDASEQADLPPVPAPLSPEGP
jgi:peptidoglycan/LPS O-acetylase OafA/YrhL